jgi:hypothetical protein
LFLFSSSLDATVDQCLSSTTNLNKSTSDLLSLAHLSSSQTPLSSSISTVNAQTLPSPSNSTNNSSTLLFQKSVPTNIQYHQPTQTVRPATTSNIQFVNTNSSNPIRPIIFHQKPTTNSTQPQLLTVMPAGVRVQQLTPIVRGSSTQPTTIVRLMSPATTTVRTSGTSTGQQQFIQLNTNKQQQPLVIKAITANRQQQQQQPVLLTANTQQKMMTSQNQQQVLVLNQNTFSTTSGQQQPKFTLQMTNLDHSNPITNINNGQQESITDTGIPQLDGSVDDQVNIFHQTKKKLYFHFSFFFLAITKRYT